MSLLNNAYRKKVNVLLLAMALTSIYAVYVVATTSKSDYFQWFPLLPAVFLLCVGFGVFISPQIFYRVSILITILLYFIRMVITPISMSLGSFATFVPIASLQLYMKEAIALACYECVLVFGLIFWLARRDQAMEDKLRGRRNNQWLMEYEKHIIPKRMFVLLFIMVIYVLILVVSDPTIPRSMFGFIFGTPSGWKVKAEFRSLDGSGSGPLGILVTLVQYIFWQIQAFLPAALIMLISDRKKMKDTPKIVLSMLIILVTFVLVTETRAHSVEVSLALVLIMVGIYQRKVFRIVPFIIVGIIISIAAGLLSKSRMNVNGENISMILTSYFSGIPNIAAAIHASKDSELLGIGNIIPDILVKIPLLGSFLSSRLPANTNAVFNSVIWPSRYLGMIIPAIGQGYSYFGFVFAPLVPLFSILISYRFELLARISTNILPKAVFYLAAIMLARSSVSSNMMSAVIYLSHTLVSYLILRWAFASSLLKQDERMTKHNV